MAKEKLDKTKQFVERSIAIHGKGTFDYSKTTFACSAKKVVITCPTHGPFWVLPSNHLRGSKCAKCARLEKARQSFKAECEAKGVDYFSALKRRQNGMSTEDVFSKSNLRNVAKKGPITINGEYFPNLRLAIKRLAPTASEQTIRRALKKGASPEEAFAYIPNPGYVNGIIYKITCSVNGLIYIGQTIQSLEKRFQSHIDQAFSRSAEPLEGSLPHQIRLHGKDAFSIEKIDDGQTYAASLTDGNDSSLSDLSQKEAHWIERFNSVIPNGMNVLKKGAAGGSTAKETVINGRKFNSAKDAANYLADMEGISFVAAKKRISDGRLQLKTQRHSSSEVIKTKEYKAWSNIRTVTCNERSKDYIPGATYDPKWDDFRVFIEDIGLAPDSSHCLTRIDYEKPFEKANVRWCTRKELGKIRQFNNQAKVQKV